MFRLRSNSVEQCSSTLPNLYLILSGRLGGVHRHIGTLRQRLDAVGILRIQRDPDTARDMRRSLRQIKWLGQAVDQLGGDL